MNWKGNLDVCLGIDRVMIMMSNQTDFISASDIQKQILHEGRDASSHPSWCAKNLALRLAYRRSPNNFCWVDVYCPHFLLLSQESLLRKVRCSIPTSILYATVTTQAMCRKLKCRFNVSCPFVAI